MDNNWKMNDLGTGFELVTTEIPAVAKVDTTWRCPGLGIVSVLANVVAGYNAKKNGLGTGFKLAAIGIPAVAAPLDIIMGNRIAPFQSAEGRIPFALILLGAYAAGESIAAANARMVASKT